MVHRVIQQYVPAAKHQLMSTTDLNKAMKTRPGSRRTSANRRPSGTIHSMLQNRPASSEADASEAFDQLMRHTCNCQEQ
jgi:hypothetical protein